jgi:predicted ATP-dependent endonuclease of OLD family
VVRLSDYKIRKIKITNFRSISNLTVDCRNGEPLIVCGPNNIGKTNFLRALDLFFAMDKDKFVHELDIPYHIAEGSAGGGSKSNITVEFSNQSGDIYIITTKYSRSNGQNIIEIDGKKNGTVITHNEIIGFMSGFKFTYIQSNNIDLPSLIATYFTDEILPGLDRLRRRQTEPLNLLNEFIVKSKDAVLDIERGITSELHKFTHAVSDVNPSDWQVKVLFPEFDYLREAISNLVTYTLFDSNDRPLDTKGSGIQRLLLLALIKYVSQNSSLNVIWALDEPEVFLQPGLQREVFYQLKDIAADQDVFVTTHSSHFIDLDNLDNTYLFDADYEVKEYARKPGRQFIKVNTNILPVTGYEKIERIKSHMGILRNDGWHITPLNLLVEGDIDKEYLEALSSWYGIQPPNILVAGGADKLVGYLEFLKEFCSDLQFTPKVVCLLDHDAKGKEIFQRLRGKVFDNIDFHIQFVKRCDGHYNANLEFEFEDIIFTELIIEASNRILRRKGYRIIGKRDQDKRTQQAYINMGVLKFISQITLQNNTDKAPVNFESQALKIYLSKEVTKLLQSRYSFDELIQKYTVVSEFIATLFSEDTREVVQN